MIIIRLIRYLFGYVTFRAVGGFPERFLNLCSRDGIPLWNVRSVKSVLYADTTIRGYKSIRRAAKRSGMVPRSQARHGLPFFFHTYRRRVGVLIGIGVIAMTIAVLSTMIWTVRVEGGSHRDDEQIISVFESLGVKPGTRISAVDVDGVILKAYKELPELSWMALNMRGSSAVIEVRERVPVPEIEDMSQPSNLIAAREGQIVRVEAYSGSTQVDTGSAVLTGDLLVSGAVEHKDGGVTLARAGGKVIARTKREITVFVPFEEQVGTLARVRANYTLYVFGVRIPFGLQKPQGEGIRTEKTERYLEANGVRMPVSMQKQAWYQVQERTVVRTKEEALQEAAREFDDALSTLTAQAEIQSGTPEVRYDDTGCTITAVYDCIENIAREVPLVVEKNQ